MQAGRSPGWAAAFSCSRDGPELDAQPLRGAEHEVRVLAQCLKVAQPEGYVRLIVDEGARIAAPLAEIYREWRAPGPSGEEPSDAAGPAARDLVEPPNGRELDVLRLIAAGCTNQEIAAQLFIAESTVKRRISNLYGKLGVTHRTEVLIRARELGLL